MTLVEAVRDALARTGPLTAGQVAAAVFTAAALGPEAEEVVTWHLTRMTEAGEVLRSSGGGEIRYRLADSASAPAGQTETVP